MSLELGIEFLFPEEQLCTHYFLPRFESLVMRKLVEIRSTRLPGKLVDQSRIRHEEEYQCTFVTPRRRFEMYSNYVVLWYECCSACRESKRNTTADRFSNTPRARAFSIEKLQRVTTTRLPCIGVKQP